MAEVPARGTVPARGVGGDLQGQERRRLLGPDHADLLHLHDQGQPRAPGVDHAANRRGRGQGQCPPDRLLRGRAGAVRPHVQRIPPAQRAAEARSRGAEPMTTRMLAILFVLATATPARADVTIKASGTGEGLGMSGSMSSTSYIKGLKMRVDGTLGKKASSTIFDVENQKMIVLDEKKKEAEVWNMTAVSEDVANSVAVGGIQTTIKPNGQTKQIAGQNADGYDLEIIVPVTLGGAGGMPMT